MKRTNETGRSMVEMLGVLAIIGVLSIGGIAGYSMAMNRYRANEALDMATKYAVVVFSGYHTAAALGTNAWDNKNDIPTLAQSGLIASGQSTTNGGAKITYNGADLKPLEKGEVPLTIDFGTANVCKSAMSILGLTTGCTSGEEAGSELNYTFVQS